MEKEKLKRKGKAVRTEKGEIALVNEENQGFRVDEIAAAVWQFCDGKSEEEVVDEIASKAKAEKERVKPLISEVVSKLKSVKLIE